MARRLARRSPLKGRSEVALQQGVPDGSEERSLHRLRAHARRDRALGGDERRRARAGDGAATTQEFGDGARTAPGSVPELVRAPSSSVPELSDVAEVAVPAFA